MLTGSYDVIASAANARFLASVRVAVGAFAFAKGVALLLGGVTPMLVVPWIVLSVLVLVGWRGRWAASGMVLLGVLLLAAAYRNHLYLLLLMLFLIAVSGCERHYALRPRGNGPAAGWPVFLMRCQVSIVYVWSAVGKVNPEFLSGDVLTHYFERSVFGVPWLAPLAQPLAPVVVALEAVIGVAVWWPRLRPVVFAAFLPLHAGMLLVSTDWMYVFEIALFAALMATLLSAFVDGMEGGRLVVWDDSCSFCRRWVAAFRRLDRFGALRFVGASSREAYDGTGITPAAAYEAMQLVEPGGRIRGGFDAVRGIVGVLPGGFLLAPYMALPGVHHLGVRTYRRVAARRTCNYEPQPVGANLQDQGAAAQE